MLPEHFPPRVRGQFKTRSIEMTSVAAQCVTEDIRIRSQEYVGLTRGDKRHTAAYVVAAGIAAPGRSRKKNRGRYSALPKPSYEYAKRSSILFPIDAGPRVRLPLLPQHGGDDHMVVAQGVDQFAQPIG